MTRSPEDSDPREPPESESSSILPSKTIPEDSFFSTPERLKRTARPTTRLLRSKDSSLTSDLEERESIR